MTIDYDDLEYEECEDEEEHEELQPGKVEGA